MDAFFHRNINLRNTIVRHYAILKIEDCYKMSKLKAVKRTVESMFDSTTIMYEFDCKNQFLMIKVNAPKNFLHKVVSQFESTFVSIVYADCRSLDFKQLLATGDRWMKLNDGKEVFMDLYRKQKQYKNWDIGGSQISPWASLINTTTTVNQSDTSFLGSTSARSSPQAKDVGYGELPNKLKVNEDDNLPKPIKQKESTKPSFEDLDEAVEIAANLMPKKPSLQTKSYPTVIEISPQSSYKR